MDLSIDADRSVSADDQNVQTRETLLDIYQELVNLRDRIPNDALQDEVFAWFEDYWDQPHVSLGAAINDRLTQMSAENAMYRTPGARDGAEEFPDACEGCQHYGIACPVQTDVYQIERREQIMREAETDEELRRKLQQYAVDNGCHIIQEAAEQSSTSASNLLMRGTFLLALAQEQTYGDNVPVALARTVADLTQTAPLSPVDLGIDLDAIEDPDTVDELKAEMREARAARNGETAEAGAEPAAAGGDD